MPHIMHVDPLIARPRNAVPVAGILSHYRRTSGAPVTHSTRYAPVLARAASTRYLGIRTEHVVPSVTIPNTFR